MNAPEGKRSQAAIQADIDRWVEEHVDDACCETCGAIVQQTTLYASVHEFADVCAGSGQVIRLPLPYCNTCEPSVAGQTQRTCIHEVTA